MPLPQRKPDVAPEIRPKANVIELNTIKGGARRDPFVFKAEPPVVAPRTAPYVFPETGPDPDASARRQVRLFDFLASERPFEGGTAPKDDPWSLLTQDLDRMDDPDAVSDRLAGLLSQLDDLAERRSARQRRVVPPGAVVLPPLGIATALLALNFSFAGLPGSLGLAPIAPWLAAVMAVPMGLALTGLVLRRVLRKVKPGESLRLGEQQVKVLAKGVTGWRVECQDGTRRAFPYYLAVYAAAERISAPLEAIESSHKI